MVQAGFVKQLLLNVQASTHESRYNLPVSQADKAIMLSERVISSSGLPKFAGVMEDECDESAELNYLRYR